jgi:hypothetical protein
MLLIGGMAVGLNKFFAQEKINQTSTELVSLLNYARNMAVTNQTMAGFTGLNYVAVTLTTGGKMEAFPVNIISGVGKSYFSKVVADKQVVLTKIDFGGLQFAAGSGKLVDVSGVPLPSNYSVGVTVSSNEIGEKFQVVTDHFNSKSSEIE